MKLLYQHTTLRDLAADIAVVFVPEGKDVFSSAIARLKKYASPKIEHIVTLEDFKGKSGEMLSVYTEGKIPAARLFLVGLGPVAEVTAEKLRRAAAAATQKGNALKMKHIAFEMPRGIVPLAPSVLLRSLAEGAALSSYKYDKYLTEQNAKKLPRLSRCTVVDQTAEDAKELKKVIAETTIICEAVFFARNLANAPGNELYPETLAAAAEHSGSAHGFRVESWGKDRIEQEGFGGLIAVNSGSIRPPRFIIMEHNAGNPEMETIVLVGKGITFDSGGISIKPSSGMAEMKMDMCGAGAVIATMEAVSRLKIPLHVVGLVPSTENMPSGGSMRPGDIVTHYKGKTSEVDNTDAEGRLVLADALGWADQYKPAAVIDLATLTGACVVALGAHAAGMMGNNEIVMDRLKSAGETTFERVWPLPLYEEFEKQIRSDVADVKNVGGRWGGAITAGLFLKKFIGSYRWVHLDIAGPAILEDDMPYTPRGGSGYGVRLLVEFLKNWQPIEEAK